MKIILKAENLLEWIALKLNLAPTPLVDTQVAFNAAIAIMAAADLGIFEAIGKLETTADAIARTCQTNPRSTKQLLDCLVGIGYLRWRGDTYSLKRHYRKWLLKESESNLIALLRFKLLDLSMLSQMVDYVRGGQPVEVHSNFSEKKWELYQEAMRDLSFSAAQELAKKIPVPQGAQRMLDIGGSHGLYSITLCKKHPGLTSTVLELPGAIESASAIAKRYDKSGNVQHVGGNALDDDLGTNQYDLVMINNVVHHFTAEQNRSLAGKVARALKPGGIYAIGDFIRAQTPGEGGIIASTMGFFFSLTSASGNWSIEEMESWQQAAGLKQEKAVAILSIPGWKMVIAKKVDNK